MKGWDEKWRQRFGRLHRGEKKRKNISGRVLERRILKEGAQAVHAGTPTEEQQLKQSEGN